MAVLDLEARLSFERALLRVRWAFLVAPVLLYLRPEQDLRPLALFIAFLITLYNGGMWFVLRSDPRTAAQHSESLRWLEVAFICLALTLLYARTGAPLYDALYVYFVVVITIFSGKAGAVRAVVGTAGAVLLSRVVASDAVVSAVVPHVGFYLIIFALTAWSTLALVARTEKVQEVQVRTRELAQASAFGAAALGLSATLDPQGLLEEIVSEARRLFGAAGAYLALTRPVGAPEVVAAAGSAAHLKGNSLPVGEEPAGRALRDREPAVGRVQHWSSVAAPLQRGSEVFGVLVLRGDRPVQFGRDDGVMLSALAEIGATALANARLYETVRESEERLRKLFEAAADAVVTVDLAGRILSANYAAESLFDRPKDDLLGRSIFEFVPGGEGDRALKALATVSGGESPFLELALTQRKGESRIAAITFAPLFEGDRVTGAVCIARDVTEHKRLQQQLIDRERLAAIGELIAGIAHDLNNPLTAVQGFSQLAAQDESVGSRLRSMLGAINELAGRAGRLARNLVDFARRQEAERVPLEPATLIDDAIRLLRYQFVVEEIDVEAEVEAGLPHVSVEPSKIQQVLVNLGTNAVQAMRDHTGRGRLRFRAESVGGADGSLTHVRFSVIDNGPGVPDDLKEKVFDAFFTTKPAGEGTGLGLSIATGIVREHGGRLGVETNEWGGATFAFTLPVDSGVPEPAVPRETRRGPVRATAQGSLRILVVDDEAAVREFLRAVLERMGHHVDEAGNGEEALRTLRDAEFDAVICDLRMPSLDGPELENRLREQGSSAADRIIFATGDTARGDVLRFLDGLGRPYLLKPFTAQELARALEQLAAKMV
ncbi:MAG: response regulator [Gemmatimonadetes bacterium]|nr:response regulator [Gemmatimonadota bacterium]